MDKEFEMILLEYVNASEPAERSRIDKELWQKFGQKKVVFVMDMSGFSLLTQKFGIVHYLSMVKRMQITTRPIVEAHGGLVVKFEADNCFAVFDEVQHSVEAGLALNAAFREINTYSDEKFDIRVSIGIDYGDVLLIGGPDYFGDPVNRACKLGEDVAGPGEIYLNQPAFDLMPMEAGFHGEVQTLSISGIQLNAVKLKSEI